jgi:hypothetical protein
MCQRRKERRISKWRYHGNRGTKIMGWGDVRYCFAMAILVIKSPKQRTDCNFLAYLIQLDVDVTGNITAKLCEVGSEFNIFCTLVTMATATILNLFNSPKAATHGDVLLFYVSFSLLLFFLMKLMKLDRNNIYI